MIAMGQAGIHLPAHKTAAPTHLAYSFRDIEVTEEDSIAAKDRVTVSFRVVDQAGKELANTDRRGMPYTFVVGEGTEPLLDKVITGMTLGSSREAVCDSAPIYGKDAIAEVMPNNSVLTITMKVLAVIRGPRR